MDQVPSQCLLSHVPLHHLTSLGNEKASFHISMGSLLLLYVPTTSCYFNSYFLPEVIFLGILLSQDQEFLVIDAVK